MKSKGSKTKVKSRQARGSKASRARKSSLRDKAAEVELIEMIRRLLALPMNKRTHFLRVRGPSGGSHL